MLLRVVAFLFMFVGAAGFLLPAWIDCTVDDPVLVELPLVEISDIAVASDGSLFFALSHLGKIQKYDSNGGFIGSFPVNSMGGIFYLDVKGDRLIVYAGRRNEADEFDLAVKPVRLGLPIDQEKIEKAARLDERIQSLDKSLTAVTLTFTNNQPPIVIKRKPWHYLALGPFGSAAMLLIGPLLVFASRAFKRKATDSSQRP